MISFDETKTAAKIGWLVYARMLALLRILEVIFCFFSLLVLE